MPTPTAASPRTDQVTTYLWAFDGAPRTGTAHLGWLAMPGHDHQGATRARTALWRARGPRLRIHRVVLVGADWSECLDAELIADGDVAARLQTFARACAWRVLGAWDAPAVVRSYLHDGDPERRLAAHQAAWAAAMQHDGLSRLAARAAMYAAETELIVPSAREAAHLSFRVQTELTGSAAAAAAEWSWQERVLSSTLLLSAPTRRMPTSTSSIQAPDGPTCNLVGRAA